VIQAPDSDSKSAILILEASRGLWTFFQDDVTHITIFSRLSIRARMTVLIAYSDPLQKDKINEYKVKGIQTTFYFWQYLCGGVILVIQVMWTVF
jgi:hypothetical protein